jgi:hypothetical protein
MQDHKGRLKSSATCAVGQGKVGFNWALIAATLGYLTSPTIEE